MTNCIPSEVIFRTLASEVMRNVDDELKLKVLEKAGEFQIRCEKGEKDIVHLEAFAAWFMMELCVPQVGLLM